jgi:ABC-type transport system involved in cytochrome c biogenesis permease component
VHPFLVPALLMLYEDASLLLLAVAVVVGTHILSDRAGELSAVTSSSSRSSAPTSASPAS